MPIRQLQVRACYMYRYGNHVGHFVPTKVRAKWQFTVCDMENVTFCKLPHGLSMHIRAVFCGSLCGQLADSMESAYTGSQDPEYQ